MEPRTLRPRASRRRRGGLAALFLILFAAPLVAGDEAVPPSGDGPAPPPGWDRVSPDSLIGAVRWLADDARDGRLTGTPGADAAAAWIANRMEACGLVPAFDGGSFLQEFQATVGVGYGDGNALSLAGVEGGDGLVMEKDYIPFSFSESGTVDVAVVFVGYGITALEYGYDDYADLDVAGKAVLLLRHEPQMNDSTSVFNGTAYTPYATFRTKIQAARDHGAVAMILFTGPESPQYAEDGLEIPEWGQAIGGGDLLAAHIRHPIGERLLETAGVTAGDWVTGVDQTLKPNSFALDGVRIRLVVSMKKDRRSTANVVGLIPGTDPHSGAVLLGAHYDHLGRGNSSSLAPKEMGQVHNGADDNASGTAALLELARVFRSQPPLRRTLVFAAFTGEEMGLLGSSHLASNPPVPLETVQAMVNMDMVGRPRDKTLTIGGVATSPAFGPILDAVEALSPLTFSHSRSGFGASDHTSFYVKDVPVLFFFSGLHEDYHKPSDDWEKIDTQGITEATRVMYAVVRDLADRAQTVQFVKAAEDSAGGHGEGQGFGRGYGPYLGTIPDFGDYEGGVKLAGVREGSPAEKAGIRGGDVVIRFGGRDIADLYEYTDALRAHKAGDSVTIVVLRDAQEVTLTAVLGTRE
jgi:hypothetical protein